VKFKLGNVVATPGALEALEAARTSPISLIQRHVNGDWGQLDAEDKKANEDAVRYGDRILSAYVLCTGVKIWVLTEHDRSSTCFLLPSEY